MSFIRLENVDFSYQKKGFQINNVSLELDLCSITMLVGSNGSGKTTLSKLMMGIIKPQNGQVWVNGCSILNQTLADTAKDLGYLFQNPERQLFCSSVLEEIAFSLKHNGEEEAAALQKAKELLEQFSMADKAKDFPLRLSGGEKQRLALLCVFAMNPKYFILDEPSSGIDKENKEKLMQMLQGFKAQGAGICIITHDKALTKRLADRIVTMEKGRVVNDENT